MVLHRFMIIRIGAFYSWFFKNIHWSYLFKQEYLFLWSILWLNSRGKSRARCHLSTQNSTAHARVTMTTEEWPWLRKNVISVRWQAGVLIKLKPAKRYSTLRWHTRHSKPRGRQERWINKYPYVSQFSFLLLIKKCVRQSAVPLLDLMTFPFAHD